MSLSLAANITAGVATVDRQQSRQLMAARGPGLINVRGVMTNPINSEAAANAQLACYMAFGDNEGEMIQATSQGEIGVGQANICQAGGWNLDPVPFDDSDGVRTFAVAAAPKENADVCEIDDVPLPLVRVADDEAAAGYAAKSSAETPVCPANENMSPCPDEWVDSKRSGYKHYEGSPSFFHCGLRGLVADCSPDRDHLQQECFYNDAGRLIKNVEGVKAGDYVDIDYRCAGTPNADDAREHPGWHFFTKGGVLQEGWTGAVGTILYDDRLQHETENETDPPDEYDGR